MSMIFDNRLLKNYTKIWKKVSIIMNIKFDSAPGYGDNDKYIKAKIKTYRDKVNKNFQAKNNTKIKWITFVFVFCHW